MGKLGDGLYACIGAKSKSISSQMAYRFENKQKVLTLGRYPEVSLAEARKKSLEARQVLANGRDPGLVKKSEKEAALLAEKEQMNDLSIVNCTFKRHAEAILDIFNDVILTSTALYDYKPRMPESMVGWFKIKQTGNFPVIGIEDSNGTLLGFGSYGTFRAWPAYKYSVEHSVYVHKDHRGRGLGRMIMLELIDAARKNNMHVMLGGIDATNTGSISLHEKLGFNHVATLPQVGYKFGRWLDLAFYQLLLDTPDNPIED